MNYFSLEQLFDSLFPNTEIRRFWLVADPGPLGIWTHKLYTQVDPMTQEQLLWVLSQIAQVGVTLAASENSYHILGDSYQYVSGEIDEEDIIIHLLQLN